jgi:hypothetical protein
VDEFPQTLRQIWSQFLSPDDYETHMAAAGQAQANGDLLRFFLEKWPPSNPSLLFAGMGTGQILDYAGASVLKPYELTFTDINPLFLERLERRLTSAGLHSYQALIDDLEDTKLSPPFGAAIVILVLEHIDWRKGVESLARLEAQRCYIVVQENPPGELFTRPPVGTMGVFQRIHPNLVPPEQLVEAMTNQQYTLIARESRMVRDQKKMTALIFDLAVR